MKSISVKKNLREKPRGFITCLLDSYNVNSLNKSALDLARISEDYYNIALINHEVAASILGAKPSIVMSNNTTFFEREIEGLKRQLALAKTPKEKREVVGEFLDIYVPKSRLGYLSHDYHFLYPKYNNLSESDNTRNPEHYYSIQTSDSAQYYDGVDIPLMLQEVNYTEARNGWYFVDAMDIVKSFCADTGNEICNMLTVIEAAKKLAIEILGKEISVRIPIPAYDTSYNISVGKFSISERSKDVAKTVLFLAGHKAILININMEVLTTKKVWERFSLRTIKSVLVFTVTYDNAPPERVNLSATVRNVQSFMNREAMVFFGVGVQDNKLYAMGSDLSVATRKGKLRFFDIKATSENLINELKKNCGSSSNPSLCVTEKLFSLLGGLLDNSLFVWHTALSGRLELKGPKFSPAQALYAYGDVHMYECVGDKTGKYVSSVSKYETLSKNVNVEQGGVIFQDTTFVMLPSGTMYFQQIQNTIGQSDPPLVEAVNASYCAQDLNKPQGPANWAFPIDPNGTKGRQMIRVFPMPYSVISSALF